MRIFNVADDSNETQQEKIQKIFLLLQYRQPISYR